MPVSIVDTHVKVQMLVDNLRGDTLTEIGEDFGVSRKTVRRCIDEVTEFLDGLSVGDTVYVADDATNLKGVIASIDSPVVDRLPVSVLFGDGVADYVDLANLIDGMAKEGAKPTFAIPVEAQEVEGDRLPVGTRVRIRKDSEYHGLSDWNPTNDMEGEIQEVENTDHCYIVKWDNGNTNCYRDEDVEVVEQVEEVVEEVEQVVDNAQYFVTAPQDSLTIVRIDQDTGEVSQRQTNKHNPHFAEIREMVKASQDQEVLAEVYNMLDTTRMLEAYSVGRVKVNPDTETVVFVKPDGSERSVPDDIASDVITTVRNHGRTEGDRLVKFLDKLMDNVSFKAIEGLYRFMKHNCIGINDDGSIQAWKGVRPDLHSNHAGKIKNSPTCTVREDGRIYNGNFGTEIRVDRSEVNDDPDQTCSHGLHVGNREYAEGFAQTLLAVKVEPQDVVAVPKDYDGAKMRCCAYTPLFAV